MAGSDTAGSDTAGSDLAGSYMAGSDMAGSDTVGSDTAGSDLAGSDMAESDVAGNDNHFILGFKMKIDPICLMRSAMSCNCGSVSQSGLRLIPSTSSAMPDIAQVLPQGTTPIT
jgi:hypothetical protein